MGWTAAGMLGLGRFASGSSFTATTLFQHETPHDLLGRVISSMMSLVAGWQVLSMFVDSRSSGRPKSRKARHGWFSY
jgi:hypothetical protein